MGFSWFLVLLSHLTYKAALILGATHLIFYWLLRHIVSRGYHLFYMTRHCIISASYDDDEAAAGPHPSCSSFPEIDDDDDQIMKMNYEYYRMLHDDDFDVVESCETCAVCLNELRDREQVRELRNCCHVFHRDCINRWLDHDDQKTCPLCRTPLVIPRSLGTSSKPSWAVERLLYLFGDDLL